MSKRTRRRHPTAACAHLRGPNQKRVADITEVRVSDYKAELSLSVYMTNESLRKGVTALTSPRAI